MGNMEQPPTRTLESLPAELLDLVIGHCEHTALKNLRITNHRLHDFATPLVFSTIYFAPCKFEDQLTNLSNIVHSEKDLGRHVTHVHFYADLLFLPEELEDFISLVDDDSLANGACQDEVELARVFDIYKKYIHQQHNSTRNHEQYRRRFQEVLSSLPNLRSAKVAVLSDDEDMQQVPVWNRLNKELLGTTMIYEDYRDNAQLMAWTTQVNLHLLEALGARSAIAGTSPVRDLELTVQANCRLTAIQRGHVREDFTTSDAAYPPEIPTRFSTLLDAFTHLTTLDLHIPHPANDQPVRPCHMNDRIAMRRLVGAEWSTILLAASSLQRLRFAYEPYSTAGPAPSMFRKLAEHAPHALSPLPAPATGKTPWPQITHLDLTINAPPTTLLPFLALLAPSLKNLTLRDMYVFDAHALIAELPKVVKLQQVSLRELWTDVDARTVGGVRGSSVHCILPEGTGIDAPYERGIKAYVLGQADDFPRLQDRVAAEDGI